jgi:hypothetical protein
MEASCEEVPRSGRGANVVYVTGQVDLRKEPLHLEDNLLAHGQHRASAKLFVNLNDFFAGPK